MIPGTSCMAGVPAVTPPVRMRYLAALIFPAIAMVMSAASFGQQPMPPRTTNQPGLAGIDALNVIAGVTSIEVNVTGPGGAPIDGTVLVTLSQMDGRPYRQANVQAGHARFIDVPISEYTIQAVAPGYQRSVKRFDAHSGGGSILLSIELKPAADSEDRAALVRLAALSPKAQKEAAKAMEALRTGKPGNAREHLEKLNRLAPNQAEVTYLFGVYALKVNDAAQAKRYWIKTLELYPKHDRALLSLADMSIRGKNNGEAMEYAKRSVEADPLSWRAHGVLAESYLLQGSRAEALREAEKALELGHGEAATFEPVLAQALAETGRREDALKVLRGYRQAHPADLAAAEQLHKLELSAGSAAPGADMPTTSMAAIVDLAAMALPASWLPAGIDDAVPPVEPGVACRLDEIVEKTGQRLQELVSNVERFTATESVEHQAINKWGFAAAPETAKYDYVVSIDEIRRGMLSVQEFRQVRHASPDFPQSVESNGLPALVLIFHPYYLSNYETTCEGLARWNGRLAWQVHFQQRSDRPSLVRAYRIGMQGQSHPVALKGRAWIDADSHQIVRLETDLVAPMPEIRLITDRIAIEYGPVHFRGGAIEMWLPQNVDIYNDWRGRRARRRHTFSNYLLFSVDDKQRISAPKVAAASAPTSDKEDH
jgi:tetratricopeptide (TPR) repeat protein